MLKWMIGGGVLFVAIVSLMAFTFNRMISDKKIACEVGMAVFYHDALEYARSEKGRASCRVMIVSCKEHQIPKACVR